MKATNHSLEDRFLIGLQFDLVADCIFNGPLVLAGNNNNGIFKI